jgi:succinate dehydrogenase/fumarate reductase flavoprotein subunit
LINKKNQNHKNQNKESIHSINNNYYETIIIGSGISGYFAKKYNKKALVIFENTKINATLKAGGFFRTKGFGKKTLYNSIFEIGCKKSNKKILKNFCNFSKKIKSFEEFKNLKKWKHGFIHNLDFVRNFQKECMCGRLMKILIKNGKVFGIIIKTNKSNKNKIKTFYCKSLILCTGGFSQYFKQNYFPTGIEIAFDLGAKIENLEFVFYHPFSFKGKIIPTENLSNAKFFDPNKKRLLKLEQIISKKNAHHLLSKIVKEYYSNNKEIIAKLDKKKIKLKTEPYFTLGGLKINQKMKTSINGLFAAGECTTGLNGYNRLGGIALSWGCYSGIIAGKESLNFNKKNNFKLNKTRQNKTKQNYDKTKPIIKNKLKFFSHQNSKKELLNGLEKAKKDKNLFAQEFYSSALKRKKSIGCFNIFE